jgi:hypothetical protein
MISGNKKTGRKTILFSHRDGHMIFILCMAFISVFLRRAVASQWMQNLYPNHVAFFTNGAFGNIDTGDLQQMLLLGQRQVFVFCFSLADAEKFTT